MRDELGGKRPHLLGALAGMMALLLLVFACQEPKKDQLIGNWKVFYVNRGGTILGGRKFNGTSYQFRKNGTVFAESARGDTLTSRFVRSDDTLKYIGTGLEEVYHIDTLNASRLVISAEIDGIPTEIRMLRLEN